MTTVADLTDAEKDQLRVLYAVYLNSQTPATYGHTVCSSLVAKHLAEERAGSVLVSITARGIEIAKTL